MNTVERSLARFGGLATRAQLRSIGETEREIRTSVVGGHVRVVRRSWLATKDADPAAVRAVELGGVLGGESALRFVRVWVSHDTGLCVAAPRTSSRLPTVRDGEYRVHPSDFSWPTGRRWLSTVEDALVVLAGRTSAADLLASIDSALFTRALPASRLPDLFKRFPHRLAYLRRLVDARSESGIESLFRHAALNEGWYVSVQVNIPRVGRVDFVINGWLVVEVDGDQWHSTAAQRGADRVREAELVRIGMRSHRFSYSQIMTDLDGCIEVVRTLLASGRP
jgi:very-short-patch-repair endonuclease